MNNPRVLINVLRNPPSASSLRLSEWDLLIRQARHANMLGRLHAILIEDQACAVPEQAARHLIAGSRLAQRQQTALRWEAAQIRDALSSAGIRAVLLKGAAYVMAGRDAARGRVFADIDILVPQDQLALTEATLMLHGWASAENDAYNQRYYRDWMHELPPMRHLKRGSVIDVHHTILPPTARCHPDPRALIAESVPLAELDGLEGLAVLAPADMFLHSATHLFFEGEGDNALRDLADLNSMFMEFQAADSSFVDQLLAQAKKHQLENVLALALRYLVMVLATPVPVTLLQALLNHAPQGWQAKLIDAMYLRILQPLHRSTKDGWTPLAREALYVRAHWLRMPPKLLARHLLRKFWMRLRGEAPDKVREDADQQP